MSRNAPPRRIVVFAPHFAEYATRLALALSERDEVLLVREEKNARAECDGLSLPIDRIRQATFNLDYVLLRASIRGASQRRAIIAAIERFDPELIHVQEQGDRFTRDVAARFTARCPIVLTVHDPVPHSGRDGALARAYAADLARLRTIAQAFHVHGAYNEARLREVLGTSKPIRATAHGIILLPPALKPIGRTFLFFGRMEAYKGIEMLLDAIDLLDPADDFKVVFAGRGPELDTHRRRIAGQAAITLVEDFLSPGDAIAQFQAARAVLTPYRDATQSGVVSAAFGNGRPVIATQVGGLVDAVIDGENGLLIPPNDPPALAAAMRELSDDPFTARLAAGARRAAEGAFAWPAVAEALRLLYDDALQARGTRA